MTPNPATILIIEDEDTIRKFLKVSLSAQGYKVVESINGTDGLGQAAIMQPELIILDLGLPDIDGVDVIRQIREWGKMPIIIVSARGKEQDKVIALDAGADDYLTKPFAVGELLARCRVALRHAAVSHEVSQPVFNCRELEVDLVHRTVKIKGNLVHLTPNEYRLLAALVKHVGKVMTHKQLLREVWGPESSQEVQYLRVYMNQLRQKIETDGVQPEYLLTEPGIGYRLTAE